MIPCSGEDMLHFPQVVGEGGGAHSPHCSSSSSSGVKSIGCPHKFHHIAEQNVIGSARTSCLCLIHGIILD